MTKVILIFSLIILCAVPIIADDAVARWALRQVQSQETPAGDAFDREKLASIEKPAPFLEKESGHLKVRHWIIRYATAMGNYPLGKELSAATLERYKDSVLAVDPLCQDMLYYQGRAWEGAGEYKFLNARTAYAKFVETFPDNPLAVDAK